MVVTYLWRKNVTVLTLSVIAVTLLISGVKWLQSELMFEQLRKGYRSRQAIVRYVQLRHQCDEDTAYRYLTTFLKKHVSHEEFPSIEYMAVHARQSFLELVQSIIKENPGELDEI